LDTGEEGRTKIGQVLGCVAVEHGEDVDAVALVELDILVASIPGEPYMHSERLLPGPMETQREIRDACSGDLYARNLNRLLRLALPLVEIETATHRCHLRSGTDHLVSTRPA
jgi:hypothetical protein